MTFFPILTGEMAERFDMKVGYLMLAAIAIFGCILSIIYYMFGRKEPLKGEEQRNCIPHENLQTKS